MAVIPPWLSPPDFLGASEAGARLGLSRQEMLQQAQEHADSIAASGALERDRMASENAQRAQESNQQNAANALRVAALKQAGLLGSERIQNQTDQMSATSALDKAREDALNRQGLQKSKDAHFQDMSRQAAVAYKASNPDISNAELMSRFPMAFKSNSEIPAGAKVVKPVATPPLFPPGVQDQIFKQALVNSSGGTNIDEAVSALNRFKNPAPAAAPSEESTPAADALTPPTAESVDRLPPEPDNAGTTVRENATGNIFIYRGDPGDIPTDKYTIIK